MRELAECAKLNGVEELEAYLGYDPHKLTEAETRAVVRAVRSGRGDVYSNLGYGEEYGRLQYGSGQGGNNGSGNKGELAGAQENLPERIGGARLDFSATIAGILEDRAQDIENAKRFSIASRKLVWEDLPPTLDEVYNSTSVAHLEGADRYLATLKKFRGIFGAPDEWRKENEAARLYAESLKVNMGTMWQGAYLCAKYFGDDEAAVDVVRHFVKRSTVNELRRVLGDNPIKIVYAHNREGSQLNRLPVAYAEKLAAELNAEVDHSFVKISDERNTNANQDSRLSREFEFETAEGIDPNARYIIVDDTWTSGQTAVSMLDWLTEHGAKVAAITTIATGRYGKKIKPTGSQLQTVLKYGKMSSIQELNQALGLDIRKATGSELHGYILQGKHSAGGIRQWFNPIGSNLPLFGSVLAQPAGSGSGGGAHAGNHEAPAGTAGLALGGEGAPTYDGQMMLPGFNFSAAYPRLDTMSDTDLVAAAVATRMALGRSPAERAVKLSTVNKYVRKLHPEWSTTDVGVESQRVLSAARKLAEPIRAQLDKGVSDSMILELLPDTMRSTFGGEMLEEARKGARVGHYAANVEEQIQDRNAKIVAKAVAVQSGLETKLMENSYGIDFVQTLMNLSAGGHGVGDDQPKPLPQQGDDGEGEAIEGENGNAAEPEAKPVEARIAQLVEEIARKTGEKRQAQIDEKKRMAAMDAANEEEAARLNGDAAGVEGDESGAGEGADLEPAAMVEAAVKKAKVDLMDPRHFALFVTALAERYWREKNGVPIGKPVWDDLVAVQFLRKTAENVYTQLVHGIMHSQARETAMDHIRKFVNIPTVQGLQSEMAFVGDIIRARMIRETQQELTEKLDSFLKNSMGASGRFKPDQEELRRKVSAEVELRARYARHAIWLTPDAAQEEARQLTEDLDRIDREFEDAGADKEAGRDHTEITRKLSVLREFGALRYKPVAEIQAALEYWQDVARGSGDEIVEANIYREERTKKAAAALAAAVKDPRRKFAKEPSGWFSDYFTGHYGLVQLLGDLMRAAPEKDREFGGQFLKWLELEIQKAGTRATTGKREQSDEFAKAIEEIYGQSYDKVIARLTAEDARFAEFMGEEAGVRVMPTKGRAMQLLVSLLQEGHRIEVEDPDNPGETIVQWVGGYHDNIVKYGREKQAAKISALLDTTDMKLIEWLGRWYESNRAALSAVAEDLFGIGVHAELANYFPVKMRLEKQGLEKGDAVGWSIFPRALTPRVKNERDFDTRADILQMFMGRMEEAEQWKAHAALGLELRGIFGRTVVREAIAANHGSNADALVQGFITDILSGHGAFDRSPRGVDRYSDAIRGWATLAALGGNVGVMFKQTTSIPAFGFEIGLVDTARHVATAFTPAGLEAMRKIFNSEERKNRWGEGSSEAVKNALSNRDGAGAIKRLFQASMITNRLGDCVPGLVVGQGIYRDALAQGMSEEDAMAYTWLLIERTQQSARMENQANFQRRNKFGRLLYQFLSTQQQYLQYEMRAFREVAANPGDMKRWGKLASTLTLNHFILSSLYFWMGELYKAMLGQEPPEDELKDWLITCLLGPFGALFVLGFTCQAALERWIKGYGYGVGDQTLPSLSFIGNVAVRDPSKVVSDVFSKDKTFDDVLEDLGRWGADANSLFRDLRKIYKYRIKGEPQGKKKVKVY